MNRRNFLSRALQYSAAGLIVPTILRNNPALGRGLQNSTLGSLGGAFGTDHTLGGKVLVLIHLQGGNDGLNTVIPFNNPQYPVLRPTIAIPSNQVLEVAPGIGLHPALDPLYQIYQQGNLAVMQGVGYPWMDLSHFRATDIWLSGSSNEAHLETGWLARFVEAVFPDFPGVLPPQPYGIQQQFRHRIPLQGDRGQVGIVVDNPESFYTLVLGSYPGSWDDQLPPTRGGAEVGFVRQLDRETFAYAESIQAAANAGSNTVEYPDTNIGRQMEVIGRLVSGSLGTPLYLGAQGGFDTHASQLEPHDRALGRVAAAIAALLQDLRNQNLDEDVVVMTVSEFGRRPEENGGFGTDHGTAAPCFVAGTAVNGGVYGSMPSLTEFDENDNFLVGQDYRGLYGRLLGDFFGAPQEVTDEVLDGHFDAPAFIQPSGGARRRLYPAVPYLHAPAPNPVSASRAGRVFVSYDLAQEAPVEVQVFDTSGRRVRVLAEGSQRQGRHQVEWDLGQLPAGPYLVRMRTPDWQQNQKVVVLP